DLGAIYTRRKDYAGAIAALQHAMDLDAAEPDAHYRLARIYQTLGKTAESKEEFAKVEQHYNKKDESLASKLPSPPPPR
ncbi:MAG: hypothetical protein DMG61_24260, partial [Acidobacteria bacterium]